MYSAYIKNISMITIVYIDKTFIHKHFITTYDADGILCDVYTNFIGNSMHLFYSNTIGNK